jgi:ElaB/YqjD/DUF883 family membrane-anchored ribosome-binding protein
METRNPGDQNRSGFGEVHSHLSQPDKGAGLSGRPSGAGYGGSDATGGAADAAAAARDRAGAMVADAKEHAEDALDTARDKASDIRHRAEETVDQARARASRAIDRAEQELEERTGVISMIRENPLPALGIAVAVGYLAAGSRSRKRGRVMNLATRQLRGAIMGGVSAALAREFRSIVSEQGGSLAAIFGGGDDDAPAGRSSSTAARTPRPAGYDSTF